ncbi:hypothetical protein S7711_10983 [Stachybotrys chartarum IBT 7711]|uniref:Ecp2 effector protein domain-containing protein n=1 Tax=Stachybotrys chartarum (strain CBS 109288 / IBT 7711) TaxID=1280523 RepID=A0A084ATH7_STACB|nr:hypothetical protein S7711_10983 [Stachybotrys chartarum IBT 7711]KFA51258.1 hypothetical protein S40293_10900 [Stachybotrys chartarum IBT 40293]
MRVSGLLAIVPLIAGVQSQGVGVGVKFEVSTNLEDCNAARPFVGWAGWYDDVDECNQLLDPVPNPRYGNAARATLVNPGWAVELFSELNCWGDSIYLDTPYACEATASGAVLHSWRLVRT